MNVFCVFDGFYKRPKTFAILTAILLLECEVSKENKY